MRRPQRLLLLPAALALAGCATVFDEDDALAITPYHIEDTGRVVIEVHVNGRGPYRFALDTAASISVMFEETRDELAIDYLPNQSALIHGAVAARRFPLIRVDRIEVGREAWRDARIVSMPGETAAGDTIDGILGVDFLRRYAVGFAARNRTVQLYSPERVDHASLRGWASVRLDARPIGQSGAALYFFEIEIEGRRIPALFDLGAGLNVINRPAAEVLGLTPVELREENRVFSDVHGDTPVVARYLAEEVTLAGIRWRGETFSVVDLGVFTTLMPDDRPAAILGAGMFSRRNFLIDFVRHRILVKVSGQGSPVSGRDDHGSRYDPH
ncbi:MAG: retroviral-like aspartic protease family protein [Woeseiaceae bacterium]